MACAVSTLMAMPRDVTCGEIGAVAKMAAANNRPMIDPAFIAFLLVFSPEEERTALLNLSAPVRFHRSAKSSLADRKKRPHHQSGDRLTMVHLHVWGSWGPVVAVPKTRVVPSVVHYWIVRERDAARTLDSQLVQEKRFNEDGMLGNETRRKACTFYMVSEHAKIGVRG